MKLRYILGGVAVALILVACSKPADEPKPAETDKATTEQVAKEAETAAQTDPAEKQTSQKRTQHSQPHRLTLLPPLLPSQKQTMPSQRRIPMAS